MPRTDSNRIVIVWLTALAAHALGLAVIPPVATSALYAGDSAQSNLLSSGGLILIKGLLSATLPGLIFGVALNNQVWRHVSLYALIIAAFAVAVNLPVDWAGDKSLWLQIGAQTLASLYGCYVGGLAGIGIHNLFTRSRHRD